MNAWDTLYIEVDNRQVLKIQKDLSLYQKNRIPQMIDTDYYPFKC